MHFYDVAAIVALALASVIADPALAGEGDSHGYRAHGAHVHGVGDLNVAVDGNALLIELHGPAANAVGFEHPPRNAAEEQTVAEVRAKLADPAATFRPNAEAGCLLTEVEVFLELAGDDAGHAHDHRHDHDHGQSEIHSDAGVAYRFDCNAIDRLQSLDIALFETFPGTERLRVQLITADTQRAAELTADDDTLAL